MEKNRKAQRISPLGLLRRRGGWKLLMEVDGADGEGHPKSSLLGRVPNLGSDGVRGVGEVLFAIYPKDDFILHARLTKIA